MNKTNQFEIKFQWFLALYTFLVFSLIILHSNLKTIYLIPFFTSITWIYFLKPKQTLSSVFYPRYSKILGQWCILSGLTLILFFFHFIGFNGIPNIIHVDMAYNGSLADHLASAKSELISINPIPNFNSASSYYPFYHFTELWLAGILAKPFDIPAIWTLLLVVYPLTLSVFLLLLYYLIKQYLKPIVFSHFLKVILLFFFIGTLASFTFLKILPDPIKQNPFFSPLQIFNSWFKSGILKLIISLPILLFIFHLSTKKSLLWIDLIGLVTVCFLYPTLLPLTCSLFAAFYIIKRIEIPHKFWLIIFTLLGILFVLKPLLPFSEYFNFLRVFKILAVRLGLILWLIYFLFKPKEFVNPLVIKAITLIILIMAVHFAADIINYQWIHIQHLDFYQLFDNLITPLGQCMLLIFLLLIIKNIPNWFSYLSIICLFFILNSLQSEDVKINQHHADLAKKLSNPSHQTKNILVVTDTIDGQVFQYYQNPYMSQENTYLHWYCKNLKLVYAITLVPERNNKEQEFNQLSRMNKTFMLHQDSLKKYRIERVVWH